MGKSVLISGAGVAGSTLAYWLGRHGFSVTVVERAADQRSSGHPVDVKGPAVAVAEAMGVMPQLREVATRVERLLFVDDEGRPRARVRTTVFSGSAGDREVEVSRADLARIMLKAAREHAEIRWGDTVTGLTPTGDGVDVTFAEGSPARFDLVVGADGAHSAVRRLAFGPEHEFRRHLGMYVAAVPVDRPFGSGREAILHNSPGRGFALHPGAGQPGAMFIFRHAEIPGLDYRDLARHKEILTAAYRNRLGRFAEHLDRARATDDLYFDAVSRIHLPRWSARHITLLGDAASSVSLFGNGSTLAIAGAHTLAEELTRSPADIPDALRRYEQRHRRLAAPHQRGYIAAALLLVPGSRAAITLRNTVIRLLPS
ncbi:FAD-dependent monooxygenase [Nocardia terpenica]|uniref:FAD-dependent monooxygenase n=1 Tax=Nocardia terpenica TaxID=455432 RepID=UPI001895F1CB|nr:FAD-dependent monooxygenase [Nocardia terpenica]MBF6062601.1 FAD-dependent monooxygenase [Nocardia terpenica]MBF6104689.1 FAD-dependent monooxygenase [Nocardia terpenica]MBF6116476.1 FAD-dependent monooxygenase [Nocardia terpenica]MBF6123439.1 FAD-dependent monooxygenase [Nocardia terpenica]MBF6156904.1 FAD-dependent monooxygenase [Nocardia terpenica]